MLGYFGENSEERIQLNLKETFLQMLFFCGFGGGFFCITVGQLFAGMNRSDLWYSYNSFNKKKKKKKEERMEEGKEWVCKLTDFPLNHIVISFLASK